MTGFSERLEAEGIVSGIFSFGLEHPMKRAAMKRGVNRYFMCELTPKIEIPTAIRIPEKGKYVTGLKQLKMRY
jgi:hypothetical protein